MFVQKCDEIQRIGCVERAVLKLQKTLQVILPVLFDKMKRSPVHQVNQLGTFTDDRFPLAPGQHCCKKASYFDVLPTGKPVGNANGIIANKLGTVVLKVLFFEYFVQGGQWQ